MKIKKYIEVFIVDLAEALKIDKLVYWLNDKLNKLIEQA